MNGTFVGVTQPSIQHQPGRNLKIWPSLFIRWSGEPISKSYLKGMSVGLTPLRSSEMKRSEQDSTFTSRTWGGNSEIRFDICMLRVVMGGAQRRGDPPGWRLGGVWRLFCSLSWPLPCVRLPHKVARSTRRKEEYFPPFPNVPWSKKKLKTSGLNTIFVSSLFFYPTRVCGGFTVE